MTETASWSVGVRRAQLAMGLGFLAMALGAFLTSSLMGPLFHRMASSPVWARMLVFELLLPQLWALVVLPLLAYGTARVVPLNPWPASLAAVLTGEGFIYAVRRVLQGDGPRPSVGVAAAEVGVIALGVWLTQAAIRRARGKV